MNKSSIFHSDPEILGGTVVFKGTRVPLQNLMDYLEGGYMLVALPHCSATCNKLTWSNCIRARAK